MHLKSRKQRTCRKYIQNFVVDDHQIQDCQMYSYFSHYLSAKHCVILLIQFYLSAPLRLAQCTKTIQAYKLTRENFKLSQSSGV